MVLDEGEISQNFGLVRLVGGESLVSQRTLFSSDSKILFCCCGRRIRVYSTTTGDLVRELRGHVGKVADFKINPKNHLQLVSCSSEGEVIYWDYTDGRILKRYKFSGFTLGGLFLHPAHNESVFLIIIKKDPTKGMFIFKLQGTGYQQKEEKKEQKRKLKNPDPEECSVGVFDPRSCKKAAHAKLNIFLETSGNSKQTTINGEGNLLASVLGRSLHLWSFTSERLNSFTYKFARFTCASFHPSEACVAAGEGIGKIILWQGLDQLESPATMVLHWHPHPVSDVVFTNDGSNLLSVGEEGVLVRWQWKTHEQQFLPRLGAPIHHVTVSPDDSLTAISQKDNIIRVICNTENKVKRTIQGLRQIDNLHMGIVFDPRSKALVTGNMPGILQFYMPTTDHHALSLDVVKQNYVPGKQGKRGALVYTKIDHVAFNDDGEWLATVERRDDHKTARELRLKFWEYNKHGQNYEVNTCVDPPHEQKIVALQFQPQKRKDPDITQLAVTAGADGKFKIWVLGEERLGRSNRRSWSCQSVGFYDDTPCQDAAFSQDGSLLAVAYSQTITLWTPETNEMRKTLALPYPEEEIKSIKFGNNSSSQYLISITNQYLTVWNLLSCSVWWSVEAPVTSLATDPQSHLMSTFVAFNKNKSHLYIFDPASPRPVAVQATVSRKTDIIAAAFYPTSLVRGSTEGHSPKMSKLYFLTAKQELFTLDCDETTSEENNATTSQTLKADPSVQQSEFLKIFGQPSKSKGECTSANRSAKPVRGTPSSVVVKQMMQTPSHVLPSVTSLCSSFLQSLLVSKHTSQREGQSDVDNDISEDEDEAMEVDEYDSDLESPRNTEGAPETVDNADNQRQQISTTDNSNLDNVNFSWLEDYFT
ncbi:unnamed protein product [Porites evermanni]|uniref:WD repeat-containing protein 75 second beta-propeller domain-containing protein n=1 Tax=Porites evermanni TaxID=104178 RepID=A0ABN8RAN1_9CNID|nr:unnamed protein product [Porites evermanni]